MIARALGLVVTLASLASAQDVRELERRFDSALSRERAAALARAEFVRATAQPTNTFTDTITTASARIVVLAMPDVRTAARAAAARLDSALRGQLGAAMNLVLGDTFTVRRDTAGPRDVVIVGYLTHSGSINRGTTADANAMAKVMAEQTTNAIVDRLKTPFAKWRRGPVVLDPLDARAQQDWSSVRFTLISSPAIVARRCYGGDLDACKVTLGLTEVDDPATAWYDSVGRFHRVRTNLDGANRMDRQATDRCQRGSDKDCISVMRASGLTGQPGGDVFRASLVAHALDVGGDGSLGRILTSTGTTSEALAAAAGLPIDTLIRQWQQRSQSESTTSRDLSLRLALVALGWVAVLAFFALRSSRWR